MDADLLDVRDELRAVARDLLGSSTSDDGPDWGLLAESGWLGLEADESLDGGGASFAEVAVILEEMGRACSGGAYLGSVALGVGALGLVEPTSDRDELLRRTVSGATRLAVASTPGADDAVPGDPPFRLEPTPDGYRISGQAAFVPDAPGADRLLVLAHEPQAGPVLVVLHADAGIDVTEQPLVDATRRFGMVEADGVEIGTRGVWRFGPEVEAPAARLLDRAALAVACDSLGLSEAMLDATVAYAGVREQFGRAIGSFQAVKHACADMLVTVTVSRELVDAAVRAFAADDPDTAVAVAMAKSYVCGAAVDVAGKAMQLHGGIGYTWESGVHAYLKRAVLNRSLFGSPVAHRRRLAPRYLGRARSGGPGEGVLL